MIVLAESVCLSASKDVVLSLVKKICVFVKKYT